MPLFSRLASTLLILLIATTTGLVWGTHQGSLLVRAVEEYPTGSTSIHLSGVDEAQAAAVLSTFQAFAETGGGAVVRIDQKLAGVDGGLTHLRVGVAADPQSVPSALEMSFLGSAFIDPAELSQLLRSEETKSIGLDANSADVLSPLPELPFAPRISLIQLSELAKSAGTVNGSYRIIAADDASFRELVTSIEPLTGQTSERLLADLRGSHTDAGLGTTILGAFLVAEALLLAFLLCCEAFRAWRTLGVHLLLGRSRFGFALDFFTPVLRAAGLGAALSAVLTLTLTRGFPFSAALAAAALGSAAGCALITLMCVCAATIPLITTNPVAAIRGRFSKKHLLAAVACFYLLGMAGFSAVAAALDGPLAEVKSLSEVGRAWNSVDELNILYREKPGHDGAQLTDPSSQHSRDFFDWYASIADQPGVFLVNTEHYGQEVLAQWEGTYQSVPETPFWYLAASPNYLTEQGFALDEAVVERARSGERVYLLPDTLQSEAAEPLRGWLREDSQVDYEPSIPTAYFESRSVSFESYSPDAPVFLWNTSPTEPQAATDPVILILTPENMIPLESESLAAVGLANSYVKLTQDAADRTTAPEHLAGFSLDDNAPEFLPVDQFIAGLKKSIQDFFALFATLGACVGAFCIVLLVTLLLLFGSVYRETLAVKRMLGYPIARLFAPVIGLILGTGAALLGAMWVLQSASGGVATIALVAVQLLLVTGLAQRHARRRISSTLTEQAQL